MSDSRTIQLPEFIEAVSTSIATVGIDGGKLSRVEGFNKSFCNMLNLTPEKVSGAFLRDFCPRYIRRGFESLIRQAIETRSPAEYVQAIDVENGMGWWRIIAHPVRTGEAEITSVLLTCLDVSEKFSLELELQVANERLNAIFQSAYDGIITIDSNKKIKIFNAAAEEMFGYSIDEVKGENISILIPEKHRSEHDYYVDKFNSSPVQSRQMFERDGDLLGVDSEGNEFPVEISISKISVRGETEYTAVVRDISEKAHYVAELKRQALVDSLTGCPNRRAFYEAFQSIMEDSTEDEFASLAIIDIDFFKKINDKFGHSIGNQQLVKLVHTCQDALPQGSIFARLGGEEFAFLLPKTDEVYALTVADHVRKRVEDSHLSMSAGDTTSVPMTISVGLAAFKPAKDSIKDALTRADQAMYAAKKAGRNCVKIWSNVIFDERLTTTA